MVKNPNEIFVVKYSKLKLGLSVFSISALGLISLAMGLIILQILLDVKTLTWSNVTYFFAMLVALLGALYTFIDAWKYITMMFKKTPMAVLNHHGYGGVGFRTWHNYNWAPNTEFTHKKESWARVASIYTLKHKAKSLKGVQSASEYVSIPLHLSNTSLKDVQKAFEYFNPFKKET